MPDMIEPYSVPRVGVGVILMREGKLLLGKRRNAHGEGEWALVGGKLEYQESIEQCAKRETREEAGIEIENLRFAALYNSIKYLPKHFLAIGMLADWKSGEPQIFPEEKISEWGWFEFNHLPEPMFHDSLMLIEHYLTGHVFKDAEV